MKKPTKIEVNNALQFVENKTGDGTIKNSLKVLAYAYSRKEHEKRNVATQSPSLQPKA
jgi:hypothetical protein